ncbi:MAG: prepilin-type N-terminal cleavage/methylation domain-containing protein [Hyphomicrobiaceae bacterium]|jgi:prepilin-type N-terminal cleavage/methylation domain-containing protein
MNRSANPDNRQAQQGGFTLVEVIVVLSVVLLLTGIAVPMLSSYMEDGRRARAEAEVKVVMAATSLLYKDVGTYPARNSSGTNNYIYTLYTGPALTANPWANNHRWSSWSRNAQRGDRLDNHLAVNTPQGAVGGAYPTTGNMRWRGPYVAGSTPIDPWGRPYIINVMSGYRTDATNYKRMWVMSAGANGLFDTNYRARATDEILGDDIGVMFMQRQ